MCEPSYGSPATHEHQMAKCARWQESHEGLHHARFTALLYLSFFRPPHLVARKVEDGLHRRLHALVDDGRSREEAPVDNGRRGRATECRGVRCP